MSPAPKKQTSSRGTVPRNAISTGAFSSRVFHSLLKQGFGQQAALNMSQVYGRTYSYLRVHWTSITTNYDYADKVKTVWDTGQGYQRVVRATTLFDNATMMGASSKVLTGFSDARLVGGAGILSGTVMVMEVAAKHYNVPLNECALSVAKVSLDLVGVVGGGVTAEFGPGAVLAVMSAISGVNDSRQLFLSCTPSAS